MSTSLTAQPPSYYLQTEYIECPLQNWENKCTTTWKVCLNNFCGKRRKKHPKEEKDGETVKLHLISGLMRLIRPQGL